MMNDDMALLRDFATGQSEHAFETLVARHIHLVHSAALRQVCDAHLAEEITQAVFIILARKAGSLGEKTILSGWLYRTAQYASADALKIQRRRQHREQEAYMQSIVENSQTETAVARTGTTFGRGDDPVLDNPTAMPSCSAILKIKVSPKLEVSWAWRSAPRKSGSPVRWKSCGHSLRSAAWR